MVAKVPRSVARVLYAVANVPGVLAKLLVCGC